MSELAVLNSTLSVLTLLFVATFVAFIFKNSKLPFAVVLVLFGAGTAFLAERIDALSFLNGFKLSPELVFYVFLPTLVFESAFHINFRQFKQSSGPILWLSTIGVFLNTALVGAGVHWFLGIPWEYALLFGALISPTDPISVLSLFKKLGAPPRLATIVEGESLINDGMALVLFEIMVGIVLAGTESGFHFGVAAQDFGFNVIGGILVGLVFGFIFSKSLDYVKNSKEIEISITLLLAHFTFIVADYFFGVSGILATVVAGLVIGNYGAYKISPAVKDIMVHFWDYVSFFANSLLFLIVGVMIWGVRNSISPLFDSVLIGIGVVLVARAVVVYLMLPLLNLFAPERKKIPGRWIHLIQWSGLRGALVLALVLTLPTSMPYYSDILIISTGIVFFTIVFNGFTMEPLMAILGLKRFSAVENFAYDESKLLIDKKVLAKFEMMKKNNFVTQGIYKKMVKFFDAECEKCKEDIKMLVKEKKGELTTEQIHETLKLHLLGVERRVFMKLYYYGEITQDLLNILIQNINLQVENIYTKKTPIGRLTLFNPESWLVKLIEKFGFHNYASQLKQKEVMLRYEMYRARFIATDEVLKVIKDMVDGDLFYDKEVLAEFEFKYKKWHENARMKMDRLEIRDCKSCDKVKMYLAKQAAYKVEKRVLKNFKKSGMVSEKVYTRLWADMEDRYKDGQIT